MRKPVVLVTGANGEIGHDLIRRFSAEGKSIVALDLHDLEESLRRRCHASIVGDITDKNLLQRLVTEFEIHSIFHLAALLSTRAEYAPSSAHEVNVNGTINLLNLAHEQSKWHGNSVCFMFPSSIAAYGLPDVETKRSHAPLREFEYNLPTTMYGCNKLYCEQLGRYYSDYYQQLGSQKGDSGVDFRALRFPGLMSAFTTPSGGTSDYAPEMIHAAAKGEAYECFVAEEEQLPFMAMPDAIEAIVSLSNAPEKNLSQRVYNISAFSLTAGEVRDYVLKDFPKAELGFKPDPPRAAIVASWPAMVDDSAAAKDWGWKAQYDASKAFGDYLVPNIRMHYNT